MRIAIVFFAFIATVSADEPGLEGLPVSRPLQPVTLPDVPPPPPPVVEEVPPDVKEAVEPGRTLMPRKWSSYDLLLWWSKAQPLPNLVTASTGSSSPVLGGGDTRVLVGGASLGDGVSAGFRFNLGWANAEGTHGYEFGGSFYGTRVRNAAFTDAVQGQFTAIGRPYVDAVSGQPAVLIVAGDAVGPGAVDVSTTTRVQGWEINAVRNLADGGEVTVTALGGYRYFAANEGLHVRQMSMRVTPAGVPNVLWGVYDQFDARNNFHGGQVGLKIDAEHGRWLFMFSGQVAFGTNFETVVVSGRSSATTAALPLPAVQPFNAGFLAVNSNAGRAMDSHFAVLPEARLHLGCRIGESCHFFAGYDFVYLSDTVRPGDQVDLAVDPSRSPILSDGRTPATVNRPGSRLRSDFWVQGLVLGFDCRY